MNAKERYNEWLEKLDKSDPLYQQLLDIQDDPKAIEELSDGGQSDPGSCQLHQTFRSRCDGKGRGHCP